jgi:radical SAM-linked protein
MTELVYKLRRSRIRKNSSINVSVTTFIPKAHTPFQWSSQISLAESEEKIGHIRKNLNISGINFKWQNPKTSLLEGLWARGDRRFAGLLVTAYEKGCKFDGWSDKFNYRLWEESIAEAGIDPDFYLLRKRSLSEPLPWDHIDARISKEFLISELDKAIRAEVTADCRNGGCSSCGVCDFDFIEPKLCRDSKKEEEIKPIDEGILKTNFKKLKTLFIKRDQARFFGHLELINIFLRAIRRAGIEVAYSEGFHPMPKISFEDTLPIGMESLCETLYLTVFENTETESIPEKLNRQLPEGLSVYNCTEAVKDAGNKHGVYDYEVTLPTSGFDKKSLELYNMSSIVVIERINKKGMTKKIDLKEAVRTINLLSPGKLEMALSSEPGKTVRPAEVLKRIFNLSEEQLKTARIIKTSIIL